MKLNTCFLVSMAALGITASAQAQMFSVNFTPYAGYTDTANLTLSTMYMPPMMGMPGGYMDMMTMGTVDGMMVMGANGGYGMVSSDNMLSGPGPNAIDTQGLGFVDMMGMNWVLYNDPAYSPDTYFLTNNLINAMGMASTDPTMGSLGTISVQALPEPAPVTCLGAGVLGLVAIRRRKSGS